MSRGRRPIARPLASRTAIVFLVASVLPVTSARANDDTGTEGDLRIALSRDYQTVMRERDALAAFQVYCDQVAEAFTRLAGRPIRTRATFAPSPEQLAAELADGSLHSAYLTAYEYVRVRKRVDVHPLATAVRSTGRAMHRGLLVVRASDPAKSILDLRGKTFVYLSKSSTWGYLFPQWLLCRSGESDLERFFGKTVQVTKEKSALYAVLLGEADVASVSDYLLETLIELNPPLGRKLRILERSDPLPLGVYVLSPTVSEEDREILGRCICDDEKLVSGLRESLRFIKVAAMRRVDDTHYDRVRELLDIIETNRKRYVCPVCARRISEGEVGVIVGEGVRCVRFCGRSCRETYDEHRAQAMVTDEDRRLIICVLDPVLVLNHEPRDVREMMDLLIGEMMEKHGLECVIHFLPTLEVVKDRLREGSVSLCQLTGPAYVSLRNELELEPLIRNERHATSFRASVVVSRSAGAKSLEDLRGRALALSTREDSALGIYLRTLLSPLGAASARDFFSSVLACPSEEAALRALAFGEVGVALVRSETLDLLRELKPGLCRDFLVLAKSEEFHSGPVCASPRLPERAKRILLETGLDLHNTERGRAILSFYRNRRLVRARDEDYGTIRALLKSSDD